jgi:hypothetical protein
MRAETGTAIVLWLHAHELYEFYSQERSERCDHRLNDTPHRHKITAAATATDSGKIGAANTNLGELLIRNYYKTETHQKY